MGLTPLGGCSSRAITQVTVTPWASRTDLAHTVWCTRRARWPRGAWVKTIWPRGWPLVTVAHSLPSSGRTRLCLARTSQSAGWPNSAARRISASRSLSRSATQTSRGPGGGFGAGPIGRAGSRQAGRLLGDALVAFDPARALQHLIARSLPLLGRTRPHPRIDHAQRFAIGRDRVGRMQVHPALRVVAQPAQPGNALAVEVQLRRVLQAQHHRVLGHALGAGLPVRLEDVLPVNVLVRKEAVGTAGVAPAPAGSRDAGCGLPAEGLGQFHLPPVQALVAQVQVRELLLCPAHPFHLLFEKSTAYRRIFKMCAIGCGERHLAGCGRSALEPSAKRTQERCLAGGLSSAPVR